MTCPLPCSSLLSWWWQVNDLWKSKYCHFTVTNAPVYHEATCIFMISHKHCPYVTPAGKCLAHHATHLPPSRARMVQITNRRGVKENASLCQTQHVELHQGTKPEKMPIHLPLGGIILKHSVIAVWSIHPVWILMGSKVHVEATVSAAVRGPSS